MRREPIRDVDIRRSLEQYVTAHHRDEPGTRILHELGICQGTARVDIAAVNGNLHGYEIKSEADTLDRLPGQLAIYGRTLDFVTIVTTKNHTTKVRRLVPSWWAVWVATRTDQGLAFKSIRRGSRNPNVDPSAIAELLWREEVFEELERRGLGAGLRSKPRRVLWQKLAETVSLVELRGLVRQRLKNRVGWR